jgi:hypothetical protein
MLRQLKMPLGEAKKIAILMVGGIGDHEPGDGLVEINSARSGPVRGFATGMHIHCSSSGIFWLAND